MNRLSEHVDHYYDWLKSKTHLPAGDASDWGIISTPFQGLFNDMLEIYAKKHGEEITLSDDGKTLHDLELMGVSFSHSSSRKEMLERILTNHGVREEGGELVTRARESDFPQGRHNLLQAMLEISELHVLAKHTIANVFKEDVRAYLDEQEIVYTPQFICRGTVGIEFTFDFHVAYRKKEIVLKCFNGINKTSLSSFLFMWRDICESRKNLTGKAVSGLAFVNDEDKSINHEYLDALKAGGADYVRWQDRYVPENTAKFKEVA